MNLILTNKYLDYGERIDLALSNGFSPSFVNLDGLSFEEIKETLIYYKEKESIFTIVSSDERLLLFHDEFFDITNIYLYSAPFICKIGDCISKELRPAHNLFKMYIAGAFLLPH